MMMNENGKYIEKAEYFYNKFNDLFCIVGTTYSADSLEVLEDMFESPKLLEKIEMPDYITEDYDGAEW